MSKRLPLSLGSLTLLVWSAVLVYFVATGRIDRYLSGVFQVQALVGGIGLGILGLFNLLTAGERTPDCGHDHDHGHDNGHDHACSHDHAHGDGDAHDPPHRHPELESPPALAVNYLILLVPVLFAAVRTPDAFSAEHVRNNAVLGIASDTVREELALGNRKRLAVESGLAPATGSRTEHPAPPADAATDATTVDTPPAADASVAAGDAPPEPAVDPYAFTEADLENLLSKNAHGDYLITVPEIFYTGGDASLQKVLKGKPFETKGQAMAESDANAAVNRMRIFQLFMECCAADARPLSIPVEFADTLPDFKEMRWYQVRGTLDFEARDSISVPVFKASTLDEIDPPADGAFYKPPQ